ncbi:MAG: hypothetical protein R3E50_14410 [Halioglobus sp.]
MLQQPQGAAALQPATSSTRVASSAPDAAAIRVGMLRTCTNTARDAWSTSLNLLHAVMRQHAPRLGKRATAFAMKRRTSRPLERRR